MQRNGSAGTLTAQEAVQAVNDGIIANIGALDGAVSAIVERVTAGLTAQAARLNQIGVDMTKYIASGMTTGTPNITNIIPQIVQSIITAFTAQQPKFTAAGVDIDKAIASGMVQGTPQITAKIPQIIQSILTTINGLYRSSRRRVKKWCAVSGRAFKICRGGWKAKCVL